jgi:predicted DNA-binding transcriptional regulator YafY
VVQSWADPQLRAAATDVLAKVEAVLPAALKERLHGSFLFAPGAHVPRSIASGLPALRAALRERRKIRFQYTDKDGAASARTIWPLGMFFWGKSWSVAGYCELRQGFRNFNAERVSGLEMLEDRFEDAPGRTLRDLIEHYENEDRSSGR